MKNDLMYVVIQFHTYVSYPIILELEGNSKSFYTNFSCVHVAHLNCGISPFNVNETTYVNKSRNRRLSAQGRDLNRVL